MAASSAVTGCANPRFVHAHCWVHLRRMCLAAEQEDPDKARQALEFIRTLYRHETDSREKKHEATAKRAYRQQHSAPVVRAFFAWLTQQQQQDPSCCRSMRSRKR